MGTLWHIAWREYLSYVATWGFWISLALIPVFMSIGFLFPLLAQSSEPVRYMTVIAQDARFEEAVRDNLADAQKNRARSAVLALTSTQPQAGLSEEEIRDIFRDAQDWEAARAVLKERLDPTLRPAIDGLGSFMGKLRVVDPPARSAEALRPYLLGETLIDTPDGPQPLHAAAFIRMQGDEVLIDYWSDQITNADARFAIQNAVRAQMRRDSLFALGLDRKAAEDILTARPKVEQFSPSRERDDAKVSMADRAPYLVAMGMSLLLWTAVFSIANMLLSSTVEEKANNILDSLLATVRLQDILLGKLVGVAMVSATLLFVWGAVGSLGLFSIQDAARGLPAVVLEAVGDPGLLAAFAVYFVTGYLIYGAAFIAIGSLCETMQEAQTLLTPIILFMLGPIMAIVIAARSPEAMVLKVLSWFPLYTPFVMPVRLPTGVPMIEIVLTTLGVILSTIGILYLATRIFYAGAVAGATPATIVKSIVQRRG